MSGLDVSTANDDRSGRPSTATTPSKVEQVRAAVNQDCRRTINYLCAKVELVMNLVSEFTKQLNMNQIAAKFVPRVLTHNPRDS